MMCFPGYRLIGGGGKGFLFAFPRSELTADPQGVALRLSFG
jgi:hypothetical protein